MKRDLNIVTLNIPYPPDYGGMIDSYYRIKWLHHAGVRVHLHCFEYGRSRSEELESLCETVSFYQRETGFKAHFSFIPYIVISRNSIHLLENLKTNDFPILFDGLHTTYFLNYTDLGKRKKFVRVHNVEQRYYKSLADNEHNLIRRLYYIIESHKLQNYEKAIKGSVNNFTIAHGDHEYFISNYQNAVYIPPFHPYEEIACLPGKGEYILYHGDLSVRENSLMAESLVKDIFSRIQYNCIISGHNPPDSLLLIAEGKKNIRIIPNPGLAEMQKLVRDAHINLLPVLTSNGFKMKLLIALFSGRHCIVNKTAANNFPDESLFHIADSEEDIINKIEFLMNEEFTIEMIHERKRNLDEEFSNQLNTRKLIELIFKESI